MNKLIFLFLFVAIGSQANELILTPEQASLQGFSLILITQDIRAEDSLPWLKNSLDWPVVSINPNDPIGNDMVQFQDYGSPYYHGGQDIVAPNQEKVYAPITGVLEGGYYSYTENNDGSLSKWFKPWPASGNKLYFELAIVSPEGYRFEMHHVDPTNLPQAILDALNQGGVSIMAGSEIGRVVTWPMGSYHHIHYNIVEPNGVIRVNAEWVSKIKLDQALPQIQNVFVMTDELNAKELQSGEKLGAKTVELVVRSIDQRLNGGYEHPPARLQAIFQTPSGEVVVGWDFRQRLIGPDGQWPDLFSFYKKSLRTSKGSYRTWGDYGKGNFLIRLDLPKSLYGDFYIEAEDMNGNVTRSETYRR